MFFFHHLFLIKVRGNKDQQEYFVSVYFVDTHFPQDLRTVKINACLQLHFEDKDSCRLTLILQIQI